MDIDEAAVLLLRHLDASGITVTERTRGWNHMGALICDAALQPRTRYRTVVEPRVRALRAAWPDADTVSRFADRLRTSDIGTALNWRGPRKLRVIHELTAALQHEGVETVSDLRQRLAAEDGLLRARLREVRRVGPKTVDYLSILAGSPDHVAVDVHINGFVLDAGIPSLTYSECVAVVRSAAAMRGWAAGDLDAAIWDHMSRSPSMA
ncbi:hypothetical protein [Blastococcus sp. URHD0036]|uniref:hypothetical protein n=1 Tax=Blastococcus sp. URHD0036 TaxID=1380356 RepID=UPI000690F750|nr:hypothetical protein [Blastococcus sp. URHD0036]